MIKCKFIMFSGNDMGINSKYDINVNIILQ